MNKPNRLQKFLGYENHAWFKRSFKKLTKREIEFGVAWIKEHDHLNIDEFQKAINRVGLDQTDFKKGMKNFERIQEMISNSNTI